VIEQMAFRLEEAAVDFIHHSSSDFAAVRKTEML
jgi:hypothetical protein